MRTIYMYRRHDGELPVVNFFNKVSIKIRNKFRVILELMIDERNNFAEVYVKPITLKNCEGLYIMRLCARNEVVSVIYYEADGDIILLHVFYRRSGHDTKNAIEHTLKLLHIVKENDIYPSDNLSKIVFA